MTLAHALRSWRSRAAAYAPALQQRCRQVPALAALAPAVAAGLRRFALLAPRERTLVVLASAGLLLFGLDSLLIQPAWRDWQQTRLRLSQARDELSALDTQVAGHTARQMEQQQQLQAEWRALQARARRGEFQLAPATPASAAPAGNTSGNTAGGSAAAGADLVSAPGMLPLLERLLAAHPGLQVRALTSLGQTALDNGSATAARPATPAAATGVSGASSPSAGGAPAPGAVGNLTPTVYRHGVELTLEGGWRDLVVWLQALENSPLKVLWGGLKLEVEHHPRLLLTLRLYTLSLDAGWVEIRP